MCTTGGSFSEDLYTSDFGLIDLFTVKSENNANIYIPQNKNKENRIIKNNLLDKRNNLALWFLRKFIIINYLFFINQTISFSGKPKYKWLFVKTLLLLH